MSSSESVTDPSATDSGLFFVFGVHTDTSFLFPIFSLDEIEELKEKGSKILDIVMFSIKEEGSLLREEIDAFLEYLDEAEVKGLMNSLAEIAPELYYGKTKPNAYKQAIERNRVGSFINMLQAKRSRGNS